MAGARHINGPVWGWEQLAPEDYVTREDAGLKSEDKAIQAGLTYLASLNVSVPKLKGIKKILEDQEYNFNEPTPAEFHVSLWTTEASAILFLEQKDFLVYKRHAGRAVVK